MPRVARNYQREDFSDLLAQMRQSATEPASEKKQRETEKANHPMQVSQAKRRRDSLMGNRLMRYAYSSIENRIHDRDCAEVSKIPDREFEMLTEYRVDMKHCWLCGRRAIVRAGVSCEDAKHMDAYMNLLQRFGAITGDLYTLIIVNHAQLFQIKQDSVCIRCKDDTWMLRGEQTSLSLYHNNYEIQQNYDRIIKPASSPRHFVSSSTRYFTIPGRNTLHASRQRRWRKNGSICGCVFRKYPMYSVKNDGLCFTAIIRQSIMRTAFANTVRKTACI